ncbi:gluconate 2-dehydrogenase subunit 3 family protein [Pontibacter chinhatensis]|uniref:Gluconate 2-dehydrogenase subunit 3 n=1 Tax=Pontibacter chinhatensis TaxID=1436961 RepID=A0A1I2PJT2_9BACT|nr:gluconate 2-dehydrogenase subunit 3 family protein [Pontibacter chinhatensis]SFG16304.1 Gluconate 2-dehydrogenase subunit 3 [Pontibacter chinhatensis]
MDRRESFKAIVLGAVSSAILLESCGTKTEENVAEVIETPAGEPGRMPEEVAHQEAVSSKTFFAEHEMATITLLANIIIPADEKSGNAEEAGVPEFIEFIVKDKPEFQTPMRSGLKWLDIECLNRFEKAFKDCDEKQQMQVVDAIAYPQKAAPEMKKGVAFFSLMRNLTATGFFTSEMGVKDLGYEGNRPNLWKGVPDEVLKEYNLAYTEKELRECVRYDDLA